MKKAMLINSADKNIIIGNIGNIYHYSNIGKKLVELDSGEKYEFHWCDMKKEDKLG